LTVENRFPFPLTVGASPLESDSLTAPQTVPALSRCCLPIDPYGDVAWRVSPDLVGGRAGVRNVPYMLHDQGAPSCSPLFTTALQSGSIASLDDNLTLPTFLVGVHLNKELALIGDGANQPHQRRVVFPQPPSPDACILALQLTLVGIDTGLLTWSNLVVQPAYDFAPTGADQYFATIIGQERRWNPLPDGLPNGSSVVIDMPGAWGVVLTNGANQLMHLQAELWVGVPGL
jgi:hypothetical protein